MSSTLSDRNHGGVRADPVGPDRPPPINTRIGEDRHEAIDHHRADLERIASKRTGDDEPTATAVRAQARLDDHDRYRQEIETMTAQALQDLRPDAAGLEAVLDDLGIEAAFDVRSVHHWWRHGSGKWQRSTDRSDAALQERIAATYSGGNGRALRFSRDTWPRSLNALLHYRERDFFQVWLDRLPAWDGEERLPWLLSEAFTLEDPTDELAYWAGVHLCLCAGARAAQPGLKSDEILVIVGPQGCGKSSLIRLLLPDGAWGDAWFSDSLNLSSDTKARVEAMQGRVFAEISEMAGSTRAEIDSLKSFIVRQDDGSVRLSYRRNPEPIPRRAVLVGTTNDCESLPNDSSGNRRFVPVTVTDGDPAALRRRFSDGKYRDQLWAEALVRHHDGEHPRLPDRLKAAQAARAEAHRYRDPLIEDTLRAWLARQPETFTLADAAQGAGIIPFGESAARVTPRDQNRLRKALRVLRCDTTRTASQRLWTNPLHGTAPDRLNF